MTALERDGNIASTSMSNDSVEIELNNLTFNMFTLLEHLILNCVRSLPFMSCLALSIDFELCFMIIRSPNAMTSLNCIPPFTIIN